MSDSDKDQRTLIDQFTLQAQQFREFAELPGQPRDIVRAATDIRADDIVLDVACGPGVTTCDLAAIAAQATGIDVTEAMIEQARDVQRKTGCTNVSWLVHAVPPLPFDDETFSLVFTRYSFHHFPDPLAVLREMTRVCKPDGRVVVVDVFMTTMEQAAAYNRMEKLRDPSHGRALLLSELYAILLSAGFQAPRTTFYRQPMTLKRLLGGSFPNPGDAEQVRQIMTEDVGKDELGLGAQQIDGDVHFAFPIAVLVGDKST